MRRVIKIGGSMLLREDLPVALQSWVECQEAAENLVIVGGGALVDAIRELDAVRKLDPTEVHWMCVDLLQSTYEIAKSWFEWPGIDRADELSATAASGFSTETPTLVAVAAFYDRQRGSVLPTSWKTTSDAIAGLLAIHVTADEMVLLKSCEVDPNATFNKLSRQGIVDEVLPTISGQIPKIRVERLNRAVV